MYLQQIGIEHQEDGTVEITGVEGEPVKLQPGQKAVIEVHTNVTHVATGSDDPNNP